ncbi:MAG: PDZ domain-containing protein [Planctomycetota bacterium]
MHQPFGQLVLAVALSLVAGTSSRAAESLLARSHLLPVSQIARPPASGAGLGISLSRATVVLRQQLALKRGAGLVVDQVVTGSPAEAAGFIQHDVLVRLDDQLLVLPQQFDALLEAAEPDDLLECTVLRGGREVAIPLGRKPDPPVQPFTRQSSRRQLRATDSALAIARPAAPVAAAPGTGVEGQLRRLADETLVRQDTDYEIRLSRGEKTRLVVSRAAGGVVFEGPIDDPEIRSHVPEVVRGRVAEMERLLEPRAPAATAPTAAVARPVAEIGRLDVAPIELR